MRKTIQIGLTGLLLLMASVLLHAQPGAKAASPNNTGYIEVYDAGAINWSEGVLTATGIGLMPRNESDRARAYLKARSYARLDALANLLMLIDRVQIDAQYVGADYTTQSEEIRASISGFIRGAQIIDERKVLIEGQEAVQVTVGTAMYGQRGLSRLLMKPSLALPPKAPEPSPTYMELVAPNTPATGSPTVEGNYTGLIIDARGLKVQPAMAPRILKADGTVLYGTGKLDPDQVVEKGMAAYYRDMWAGRADARAGSNPLIIRPIGTYRRAVATTDVVISDADAAKLLAEDARTNFLKAMKVVFVVD
ncbi:MAG: hypothetical protein NZL85_02825 [Fimbriimonadales bacterium]|nr:hypothetical protein [Fimbriimonadales bacterium]